MKKFFPLKALFRFFCVGRIRKASSSVKNAHSCSAGGISKRLCRLEFLEERNLLSITAIDYAAIQAEYSDFNLNKDYEDINIIELSKPTLEALQDAVQAAAESVRDDLIVISTSSSLYSVAFSSSALEINLSGNSGRLTIVSYGETVSRWTGQSSSPMVRVRSGDVQIGGVAFLGAGAQSSDITLADVITVTEGANLLTSNVSVSGNAYYVGAFYDANKTSNDSELCWAGAASNVLYYTDWAGTQTGMVSETETFDYFKSNFTNGAGKAENGVSWFVTGEYRQVGGGQPTSEDSGGFYPDVALSDIVTVYDYENYQRSLSQTMTYLQDGCGITAALGWYSAASPETMRGGGHTLTVWGYLYDSAKYEDDPAYYTGLIVTDTDDHFYGWKVLALEWNSTYGQYRFSDYYFGNGWLEEIMVLVPSSTLATLQTPVLTVQAADCSIQLRWTQTVKAASYAPAGFRIRYKNAEESEWRLVELSDSNLRKWSLTNILEDTDYEFQIQAVAREGMVDSEWSSILSVRSLITTCVTTNLDVVDASDGLITLREAVLYAESKTQDESVSVTFNESLAGKTIVLDASLGEIKIHKSLVIDASDFYDNDVKTPGVMVDAYGNSRIFSVVSDDNVLLKINGLGILNGNAVFGGGIYSAGSVVLINTLLQGNKSNRGAVYVVGNLEVATCVFVDNVTSNRGGAVCVGGSLVMKDSELNANSAIYGGGIYVEGDASLTNVQLSKCVATGASGCGGGIYLRGTLTVVNSQFSECQGVSGGGIYVDGTLEIQKSNILSCSATSGGGIYVAGNFNGTEITLDGNSALEGGGIELLNGKENTEYTKTSVFTLTKSVLSNNTASVNGGGINRSDDSTASSGGGTMDISDTVFSNNTAYAGGGLRISDDDSWTVSLLNSTLSENKAVFGAGINANIKDGEMYVANTLIVKNSASNGGGGGIYNYLTNLTIVNSTIAENNANSGGAIFAVSLTTVKNCVIVLNANTADSKNIYGQVDAYYTLSDYSAWHNASDLTAVHYSYDAALPLFKDLENGNYTLAKNSQAANCGDNSLAVDREGNPLKKDLAGNTRIIDQIVDLGAYESPAKVCLSVKLVASLSPSKTEISETLTDSESLYLTGQTIYAQIWIQNLIEGSPKIESGYLDLYYNDSLFTVVSINYSSLFSRGHEYTDLSRSGVIASLGGEIESASNDLDASVESTAWIQLATVVFETIGSADSISFTMQAAAQTGLIFTHQESVAIDPENIIFSSAEFSVRAQTLAAPDGIKIVSQGANRVLVTWNEAEYATGYAFSWSTDGETWRRFNISETSYYLSKLNYKGTLRVRIAALYETNTALNSSYSPYVSHYVCPVDIDGDGIVGLMDLSYLSEAWMTTESSAVWNPACDIDGDGMVGFSDYILLSLNWFKGVKDDYFVYPSTAASSALPVEEPETLSAAFSEEEDLSITLGVETLGQISEENLELLAGKEDKNDLAKIDRFNNEDESSIISFFPVEAESKRMTILTSPNREEKSWENVRFLFADDQLADENWVEECPLFIGEKEVKRGNKAIFEGGKNQKDSQAETFNEEGLEFDLITDYILS